MIKIDKIFGDKKVNTVIYILLAVGIFMLTISSKSVEKSVKTTISTESKAELSGEEKLKKILSEIEGVGEVSVMLCSSPFANEPVQSVFSQKETEQREKTIGVLIVAQGGSDAAVREKIIRATKAALGVDSHKIEVLERNV